LTSGLENFGKTMETVKDFDAAEYIETREDVIA
jgi:hypothetical protein